MRRWVSRRPSSPTALRSTLGSRSWWWTTAPATEPPRSSPRFRRGIPTSRSCAATGHRPVGWGSRTPSSAGWSGPEGTTSCLRTRTCAMPLAPTPAPWTSLVRAGLDMLVLLPHQTGRGRSPPHGFAPGCDPPLRRALLPLQRSQLQTPRPRVRCGQPRSPGGLRGGGRLRGAQGRGRGGHRHGPGDEGLRGEVPSGPGPRRGGRPDVPGPARRPGGLLEEPLRVSSASTP